MATSRRFNFEVIKRNLEQTKRELPVLLAKQAENYFTGSFKKGALGSDKWPEVERRKVGTSAYKYPKKKGLSRRTSPILVRRGILRGRVSNSIRNANWNQIKLIVDLPYAMFNQEGTDTIPARQFMKQTTELGNMQKTTITKTMNRIWKV